MPTIEDVTHKLHENAFQEKTAAFKRKSGSVRKMYRSENTMIRPRKVYGAWVQPRSETSIFKFEDFHQSGKEVALTLPMEPYRDAKVNKPKTQVEKKNMSKVIFKEFENYCDRTTLHGLRYVGDPVLSFIERFFWILAFCSAIAFACYYIGRIFEKWNTNPVLVAFNPTDATFNDIPFPAITICNMNQVKKVEAERILRENNPIEKELLSDFCNNDSQINDMPPEWELVQNFLIKAGQGCSDILKTCFWQSDKLSCEEYFNNDLTDEGLCCSFNRLPAKYIFRNPNDISLLNHTFPGEIYDWSPEKGFPHPNDGDPKKLPIRPVGAGSHLGLTIIVDAQVDNYFCSSTDSVGFKIILSNPIETPKIADFGFLVSPGVEARYVITPEIKEATSALRSIDVNKRQCFFQDERPLRYYRSYTTRNCRLECQSNHTLEICECIPYYLPKARKVPVCGEDRAECVNRAKKDMELVFGNGSSCNCLPSCYEMNFEKSGSYSNLSEAVNIKHNIENISDEYFRKNMAVLHFFFGENRFERLIKSEIYGSTEVICEKNSECEQYTKHVLANVGGLLGLSLGFSILSVVEIVYYLTIKIVFTYLSFRRKEKKKREKDGQYVKSVIPFMR